MTVSVFEYCNSYELTNPSTPEKGKPEGTKSVTENGEDLSSSSLIDFSPVRKPVGGAFGAWMSDNRTEIANRVCAEGGSGEELAKKASALWREMSEAEKQPWVDKYEEQRATYEKHQELLEYTEDPADEDGDSSCLSSSNPAAKKYDINESRSATQAAKRPAEEKLSAAPKKAKRPPKAVRFIANTPRLGSTGWQLFTPNFVNPKLCMARTWAAGYGGQCTKGVLEGCRLCRLHSKEGGLVYGCVDGPVPEPKMKEFKKMAASWA